MQSLVKQGLFTINEDNEMKLSMDISCRYKKIIPSKRRKQHDRSSLKYRRWSAEQIYKLDKTIRRMVKKRQPNLRKQQNYIRSRKLDFFLLDVYNYKNRHTTDYRRRYNNIYYY